MTKSTLKRINLTLALLLVAWSGPTWSQEQTSNVFMDGSHNTDQAVDIASDRLTVDQEAQTAIFEGNVDAVQGEIQLKTERLEVYYTQSDSAGGAPSDSITHMHAIGDVVLISPKETAEGDWAKYDVTDRTIVMKNNVVLTHGDNVLRGTRLDMDLESGRSILKSGKQSGGRVSGRFLPSENESSE